MINKIQNFSATYNNKYQVQNRPQHQVNFQGRLPKPETIFKDEFKGVYENITKLLKEIEAKYTSSRKVSAEEILLGTESRTFSPKIERPLYNGSTIKIYRPYQNSLRLNFEINPPSNVKKMAIKYEISPEGFVLKRPSKGFSNQRLLRDSEEAKALIEVIEKSAKEVKEVMSK